MICWARRKWIVELEGLPLPTLPREIWTKANENVEDFMIQVHVKYIYIIYVVTFACLEFRIHCAWTTYKKFSN